MTTITLQQDIKGKIKIEDIKSWDKIILDCGSPKKEFLNLKDGTHLYYSRFAEVFLNGNNKKLVTTKGNWWTIANTEAFNEIMKVFPEASKHLKSLDTMIYYATDGSSGTRPLVYIKLLVVYFLMEEVEAMLYSIMFYAMAKIAVK